MINSTFNRRVEIKNLVPDGVEIDKRLLRAISRDIAPPIERLLDKTLVNNTPPKRGPGSPRFVWSNNRAANERARRWWFANADKFPSRNGYYARTGKLQRAWRVDVVLERGRVLIRAVNDNRGASYVYGRPRVQQVPGHKRTGWPYAPDKLAEARNLLNQRIRDLGQEIVGRG